MMRYSEIARDLSTDSMRYLEVCADVQYYNFVISKVALKGYMCWPINTECYMKDCLITAY